MWENLFIQTIRFLRNAAKTTAARKRNKGKNLKKIILHFGCD